MLSSSSSGIRRLFGRISRRARDENGVIAVEFVLSFPFFLVMILVSVELAFLSLRFQSIDRGLDIVMREIRLNTGQAMTHQQMKERICNFSGLIPDCMENMRLEMRPSGTRNFTGFANSSDCVDRAEPVKPARQFTPGRDNELMIIRACAWVKPVFPSTGSLLLGSMINDGEHYRAIAYSAFVQEPS